MKTKQYDSTAKNTFYRKKRIGHFLFVFWIWFSFRECEAWCDSHLVIKQGVILSVSENCGLIAKIASISRINGELEEELPSAYRTCLLVMSLLKDDFCKTDRLSQGCWYVNRKTATPVCPSGSQVWKRLRIVITNLKLIIRLIFVGKQKTWKLV